MKRLSIILALVGLLLALVLVGYFGVDNVIAAVGRIGPTGFAAIVAWQLVLFVILGLAWDVIAPKEALRRPWVLIWARMVRDSATNCLPFSAVGGFVFGARVATLHGMKWHTATAATVVDVTAEFLAQIVFMAIGIAILVARVPTTHLALPLGLGLAVAVALCVVFIVLQQGAAPLFAKLGRRIAGRWFDDAHERVEILQAEVGLIYGHAPRLIVGFLLHLLGWLGTGVAGWIAYRALGIPLALVDAMAIEALLAAMAAMAFLVPVSAGVQEAGYAGLGALFGVPPELSLAVSLIRRARNVVVGVPILLLWQMVEVRRSLPGVSK
ncbi:MAG: lysylphosphatidylglycerol synthase domain-containing protein [Acetobacteraceae bacterium]